MADYGTGNIDDQIQAVRDAINATLISQEYGTGRNRQRRADLDKLINAEERLLQRKASQEQGPMISLAHQVPPC